MVVWLCSQGRLTINDKMKLDILQEGVLGCSQVLGSLRPQFAVLLSSSFCLVLLLHGLPPSRLEAVAESPQPRNDACMPQPGMGC